MTIAHIGAIACRLIALLWVLRGLTYFSFGGFPEKWLPLATPFIIAALLWLMAEPIGKLLTGRSSAQLDGGSMDLGDLQSAGFAVVGVYFLMTGVPTLVMYAVNLPFMADAGGVQIHYSTFARPGAQILLGIALLFGARGLSAMLVRVRTAG